MARAYVYILASYKNGTLYIGITNNLHERLREHKENKHPRSFTSQYSVHRLVYFETFDTIGEAIDREKRLKKWNRQWKIDLIEKGNPGWRELNLSWND
ncbi:MAG: GIY-YIG nuclease family protein [Litorimonas sp.]